MEFLAVFTAELLLSYSVCPLHSRSHISLCLISHITSACLWTPTALLPVIAECGGALVVFPACFVRLNDLPVRCHFVHMYGGVYMYICMYVLTKQHECAVMSVYTGL